MQIEQVEHRGIFSKAQLAGQKTAGASEPEKNTAKSGFMVDSAPQTQTVTYGKPEQEQGVTLEDVKNAAATKDAVQMKNEMVVGANTSTPESVQAMEEDGFSLPETDIHTVVTETDKIRMQLAKAGKDTSYFSEELTPEQIAALAGSAALAAQYETALTQAEALKPLGEGALKYMLDNELEPTIGNLYQAQFNGSSAYVATVDDIFNQTQIEEQIKKVAAAAGLEPTGENLAAGKWLAANELSVTAENLSYLRALQEMKLPPEQQLAFTAMEEAVSEGKQPADACLAEGYSTAERAEEMMQVIGQVTDDDLAYVLEQGQELTIRNLQEAHNLIESGAVKIDSQWADDLERGYALLEARRILEETRLVMTTEANYSLLGRGMEIDIKPLVSLVEDLKAQEQSYYKQLLEADGSEATAEQTALFQETIETAEQLKWMPAYALGSVSFDGTVENLHTAGATLQARMEAAGESYETMMTAPRSDLGDSIKKAFGNIDDILQDIGMETTESNARAVRILAYNRMEITEESVLEMKLADRQVQQAFDSLKPAVVREMIRDGVNPLQMQMSELNEQAAGIRARIGGADDLTKFSEYLWKLEQEQSISAEERDSYIGIYRLIHQVEAGDGAAIGALVQQGAPLTMRNLLGAVRSGKKSGMDYTIDDDFDGVEGSIKGKSISDQINAAFQTECFREIVQAANEPKQFAGLLSDGSWQDLTPEQLLEQLKEVSADDAQDTAYAKELLRDMEAAASAENQVYEMLENYSVPATVSNVLAMQQMLANPNDALRRFFRLTERIEEDDEKADLMEEIKNIKEDILRGLGENIQAPEELADAMNTLAEVAEHCGQTVMYEGMTTLDIKQLQMMTAQLHLGARLTSEERYQIPVLTSDGAVGVNVKIIRGSEKKGSVAITMESEAYGRVAAELHAGAKGIKGYIASDSRAGADRLQAEQERVKELLGELSDDESWEADVQILYSGHLDLVRFELSAAESAQSGAGAFEEEAQIKEAQEKEVQMREIQTRELYGVAEKMIRFFREGITKEA